MGLTFDHMPSPQRLDRVFSALADPSRRAILERLAQGDATVGDVAEPLDMAPPSVSKHLKVLEAAQLIRRRVTGRHHHLSIDPNGFRSVVDYLRAYEQFWELSLDRLGTLVARLDREEER